MKTKTTIFLVIVLTTLFSCNNFLDEVPKDFLSPSNLPQTEEDCEIMLNGVIAKLANDDLYGRWFLCVVGWSGTDLCSTSSDPVNDRYQLDHHTVISTNSPITKIWVSSYDIINEANVMIQKIPETDLNEIIKERYVAAARFVRALMYLNLVRLWGPSAVYLEEPVEDFVAAETMPSANDINLFYDLIKSDIEYAVGKNPSGGNRLPTEDWPARGKPTFGAAKALQASIYLTMAGHPLNKTEYWEKARDAALEVKEIGIYSLFPTIKDMWLEANEAHPEFIYSIQFDLDGKQSLLSVLTRPDEGWHNFYADTTWINRYFVEKDLRKYEYLLYELQLKYYSMPYTSFWGEQQPYVKKYIDIAREDFKEFSKRSGLNFPIFRTSEVYLMIAEAENEVNGPTALAYENLNAIRTRANLDPLSGLSKEEFRLELKNERNRELCFEGKNRFDLHRWGDMEQEMLWDVQAKDYFNMADDEYFPVPDREAQLNPNLN